MTISPEDIESKRFVTTLRGFDTEEVTRFLGEVAADMRSLLVALYASGEEVADALLLEAGQSRSRELEYLAQRGLDARADAVRIVRDAEASAIALQAEAARSTALAVREAAELIARARAEADLILAEARRRSERIAAGSVSTGESDHP